MAVALLAGALMQLLSAGTGLPWAPYLVGCVGLVLLHERLRRTASPLSASIATTIVFAATSLFWVMSDPAGLAEAVSFALVAAALVVEARWQDATVIRAASWVSLALLPLGVHILMLPHRPEPIAWDQPLFSSSEGLFALTPVAYIALAGLVARVRTDRRRTVGTLLVLGMWIATATLAPVEGPGGRFAHGLTPALALLAPGLVSVVEAARTRPWPAVALLVVGALAWNYWLMVQYTIGLVPKDAPVSFSMLVRQQADVHTRTPYVYPFAFPSSLWFAWREGVPIDRYELLAFEPRHAALDLPLTRDAARFLLDGWDPPRAEVDDSLTWTRESRATLALPLALPAGRNVEIIVTARARLDNPPVNATVGIEVNGREVGRVLVPPATVADLRVSIGSEVGALFRAGYNRLALVSHGVARVDTADQRPPGPMARRLGARPWPVAVHRIRIGVREQ